MLQSPVHIGRGAAGGDRHQGIGRTEAPGLQILPAGLEQILQSFGTAQQCRRPTGQHALHQLGITAEGGRTLGSIQHPESTGGAGPQVEQAAASAQAVCDRLHRLGES